MNQTKKRLNIINLAITMTDIETIQMQTMKLNMLKSDKKLQKIISTLNAQNYAKAQKLINTYMDEENTKVVQRTELQELSETELEEEETEVQKPSKKKTKESATEKQETEPTESFPIENLEEVLETQESTPTKSTPVEQPKKPQIEYSDLISLQKLRDSVKEKRKHNKHTQEDLQTKEETPTSANDEHLDLTPQDDQSLHEAGEFSFSEKNFNSYDEFLKQAKKKELPVEHITIDIAHTTHEENELLSRLEEEQTNAKQKKNSPTTEEFLPPVEESKEVEQQESPQEQEEEESTQQLFEAIPHIEQRFKNLYTLYPPIYESDTTYLSVDSLLLQLSSENFSEQTILTVLSDINHITTLDKAEAAELLLVTSATEIPFAKFMLARELYKGEIIEQNIPEAFVLMEELASGGLGEAMCDLGQFYENGISTDIDEFKALELYRLSVEQGVQRAQPHLKRLQKKTKGFFSNFIK